MSFPDAQIRPEWQAQAITCPLCGDEVFSDSACACQIAGVGRRVIVDGPIGDTILSGTLTIQKPSILAEATQLTSTDRQAVYGHPRDNWGRTAEIASALLGRPMTPSDCCKVALAMKFARLRQTPKHRDSIVDIAGYAYVLSELEGV